MNFIFIQATTCSGCLVNFILSVIDYDVHVGDFVNYILSVVGNVHFGDFVNFVYCVSQKKKDLENTSYRTRACRKCEISISNNNTLRLTTNQTNAFLG